MVADFSTLEAVSDLETEDLLEVGLLVFFTIELELWLMPEAFDTLGCLLEVMLEALEALGAIILVML